MADALDPEIMQLAESIGLIGPSSRTHDLHDAIQRFHDLICVNATLKAAKMAADVLTAAAEPVYWEFRCLDTHPDTVTSGHWSAWEKVEPRNRLQTVESRLAELRGFIAQGQRIEIRALYAPPSPPVAAPAGVVQVCPECDIAGCRHLRAPQPPRPGTAPLSDEQWPLRSPECWCESCDSAANQGWRSRMSLCPTCGDKRCPRAKHHDNDCQKAGHPTTPTPKD